MATFSPQVQSIQPDNYLRWAKPAEKPNLLSATGIAADYLGKGIESGAEEINKGVKQYAENRGVEAGEEVQNMYGKLTEVGHEAALPGDIPDPAFNKDTLTPGKPAVPQAVEDGLKSVATTQAAYNQGSAPGHVRETQYLADLYKKASQLRAQWPGYRDYIDKGIEKATGITPNANSYIKSMLADINEVLTKKNTGDNHAMNLITTEAANGNPSAREQYALINSGKKTVQQAVLDLGQGNVTKWQAEHAEQVLKVTEAGTKMNNQVAVDTSRNYINQTANQFIRDRLTDMGLNETALDKLSKGEMQLNPEQIRTLDAYITRQEQVFKTQIDDWANKPHVDPVTGKGTNTWRVAAGKDFDEIYKQNTEVFGMLHKAIIDPNSGMLNQVANSIKDANNGMQLGIWKDPGTVGQQFRSLKAFQEFGGGQLVAGLIGRPGFTSFPSVSQMESVVGDNLAGYRTKGIDGIKETLQTLAKETHGENPTAIRNYAMALGKLVNAPEVKDEGKVNILHHLFDPKEQGWVGLIQEGGNSIARHDMYNRFTNPVFVQKLMQLADQYHDPQIKENYRNWVFNTFNKDLFTNDLQDLAAFQERQGIKLNWNTDAGHPPRFEAAPQAGKFPQAGIIGQGQAERRADEVNKALTKLNMGIASLGNVYLDQTPSIILRELQNRGIPFEKGSVADQLIPAMAAHAKPKAESSKAQERAPTQPTEIQRPQSTMNQINPAAIPPKGAAPGNRDWEHPNTVNEFIDRLKNSLAWPRMMEEFQKFQTREVP
jgi:hypothetical protein